MALCKAVTSRSFEGSLILGPVQLASPLHALFSVSVGSNTGWQDRLWARWTPLDGQERDDLNPGDPPGVQGICPAEGLAD